MSLTKTNDLEIFFQSLKKRLTEFLFTAIKNTPSQSLFDAMSYSLLNGGKHLRPLLIYATGSLFNTPLENLDIPASAVELVHTYSLIHDDLPCMDDADLRRGRPTLHKVVGEGMAVLSGDALLTLAMQIIASHPASLSAEKRIAMIQVLTFASGPEGMAAGQALDLSNSEMTKDQLLAMYRLKTGALFSSCIELARLASIDDHPPNQKALQEFGDCIGLAFQIQDDILDIEAHESVLGKSQGIDQKNQKITYPQLMGIAQAKKDVQELYEQGLNAIQHFGNKAYWLQKLTAFMLNRNK